MRAMSQHLMSLPNVWLGTTVESATYTWRIRELQATRAALRFLSFEPLLGPLRGLNMDGVDWAIVGGESGPGAREMRPNWVRKIREECREQGVALLLQTVGWDTKRENRSRTRRPNLGRTTGIDLRITINRPR